MIRSLLLAIGVSFLGSCLLFLPPRRNAASWMVSPDPGSVFSFLIATTWHDGSYETVTADFSVERVEVLEDRSILVKLVDAVHNSDFYWIMDTASDAIYESNDPVIDDGDLKLIVPPVREGEGWSFGTGDYEIQDIRLATSTVFGRICDTVEVDGAFTDIDGMVLTYKWSPDCGLFIYVEDYDSDSYLLRYRRELLGVAPPE